MDIFKERKVSFSSVEDLGEKTIKIRRVVRVLKGGRRFSFSATIVVGDKKGVVGYGLGKSLETADAIAKGVFQAKKNLIKVPLINDTIPHEVEAPARWRSGFTEACFTRDRCYCGRGDAVGFRNGRCQKRLSKIERLFECE